MIGVFFTPTELAQVVFTSPVKTDIGDDLFKEHPVYTEWKIANGKKVDGGFKPVGTMKPERPSWRDCIFVPFYGDESR